MTPRPNPDPNEGTSLFQSELGAHGDAVARLVDRVRDAGDVTLLDVRPRDRYEEAHVRGALHVPVDHLDEHRDALPEDRFLYVYGEDATTPDAGHAAFLLGQAGLPAQEVPGGFAALREHGAPLQEGPDPGPPQAHS